MRILFFLGAGLDVVGGTETVLIGLAEELARSNHSIGILELAAKTSDRALPSRIAHWTCPPVTAPVLSRLHFWREFVTNLRAVRAVVRDFAPDIVWVHFPSWQAVPLALLTALPREWRLAVTCHGSDIRSIPVTQPRLRPWLGRLFEKADVVTAVSRCLLQDLLEQHPSAKDKCHVVHNSIDASWLDRASAPRKAAGHGYVLFVGRLHPVKGADVLLRAWKSIQAATAGLELLLVGDGPEREGLEALAESLGASAVRFLGTRPEAELAELYANARLVVMPSRNEGLPLAALEAGACRAVLVASAVGGLPEVVEDGVNGFLVEPESPEALGKAVVRALAMSDDERQRMTAALRSTVERSFLRSRIARQYEALFESLMDGRDGQKDPHARESSSTGPYASTT